MLTRRRLECLRVLEELQRQRGGPVHYSVLAQEMGISRWTAYDLLRELEKSGYLEAVYAAAPGSRTPGRKQLLHRLTPKGQSALRRPGGEEWQILKNRLLTRIREARDKGRTAKQLLAEFSKELAKETSKLARSAYKLALLIASLDEVEFKRGRKLLSRYLDRSSLPEQGLNLFAGVVLANLTRQAEKLPAMGEYLRRWWEAVPKLSPGELRCLLDFLREGLALEKGLPSGTRS
ncbi:hypothetical protein [Desulfothermobacter acidiphilus]|uniref:hypothetical protein n=1 Tax=Desulfothermobacter acidiphilus TaxID=1938353 RepID=UPI003F8925B3